MAEVLYEYLLVIHIPYAVDAGGRVLTGDMWVKDLRGMARELGRITVAAPCVAKEKLTATSAGSFSLATVSPSDTQLAFLPLPRYKTLRQFFRARGDTRRLLQQYVRAARIVHIDTGGWPIPQGEIAWRFARRYGKRTLLFLGDGSDPVSRLDEKMGRDKTWLRRLGTRLLKRHFIRFARAAACHADVTFFHNPMTAERFSRHARRHLTLFRTFVDDAMLLTPDALERKIAALSADRPLRFLMAGRLIAMKGVDQAIAAVGRAAAQGARVELTIVGGGPEEPRLRQQVAESGLERMVRFAGTVQYGEPMFEFFRSHDVLLVCNLTVELSRNILLGMAFGCVVLTYENPGTRGLVRQGQNAYVTPMGDAAALGEAVAALCADRGLCARLVRAGHATAAENTFEACHAKRAVMTRTALGKCTHEQC